MRPNSPKFRSSVIFGKQFAWKTYILHSKIYLSFYVNPLFRPSFWCAELGPVVLVANTGSMTCPTMHATFAWWKEITYQIHVVMLHVPSSGVLISILHHTSKVPSNLIIGSINQNLNNQRIWDAQTCCAWLRPLVAWPCIVQPVRRKIAVNGKHPYNMEIRGILQDVAGARCCSYRFVGKDKK